MPDPDQPAQSIVFHNTIHGGQQAMGNNNVTMIQHNETGDPAQRFDALLRILKEHVADFEDPDRAGREVAAIEVAREEQQPDRKPVLTSLETLAALATVGGTLAEAVKGAIDIVTQHWPI
ncbi:hypothetical protein [Micromonospora sp. NBC_00617]|uniref:hypothetical protein n=1 Tax=Micromonospora sp. NBC_00617 TaxID=2903587 RepID=UPI0030E309C0